jgi:lactoylglutathione lyase
MTTDIRLGWVIVYVDDPRAASAFYERAFGLRPEFAAGDGSYAQMDTGATRLAFTSYGQGEHNFAGGVRRPAAEQPANVELTLVTEDVDAVHGRALELGCTPLAPPRDEPRGQRVAFVRDPFGTLVEIASPM